MWIKSFNRVWWPHEHAILLIEKQYPSRKCSHMSSLDIKRTKWLSIEIWNWFGTECNSNHCWHQMHQMTETDSVPSATQNHYFFEMHLQVCTGCSYISAVRSMPPRLTFWLLPRHGCHSVTFEFWSGVLHCWKFDCIGFHLRRKLWCTWGMEQDFKIAKWPSLRQK